MISLHVYLNPAAGKEAELDSAISDAWMTAMADQPGFISGAVLKPFSDDALAALQASVPEHAIRGRLVLGFRGGASGLGGPPHPRRGVRKGPRRRRGRLPHAAERAR